MLECHDCGAETRRFETPHALADTDAVIMVATTGRRSPKHLSADIADGVRALADVGLRWSGRYLAVDVRLGPIGVRDAVLAENVTTVVVSSIRALGLGQGDAMCTFRCLARVGLRVITANDWSWTNNRPLFGMEGAWQDRCGYGSSYEARPGYNGPTWEDEYEMFGGEDFGIDDEGGPDFVLRFVPDHRW